jgi:hypothetical protein
VASLESPVQAVLMRDQAGELDFGDKDEGDNLKDYQGS